MNGEGDLEGVSDAEVSDEPISEPVEEAEGEAEDEAEAEDGITPELRAAILEHTLNDASIDATVTFQENFDEVWVEYYPTGTTEEDHMMDIAYIAGTYSGGGFENDVLVTAMYPDGTVMADFEIGQGAAAAYRDGEISDVEYLEVVLETLEVY